MQKAGAEGALKTPNATPDALSPDHQVAPHGGRAIELFAGVGGFRIGLERTGWQGRLGNQWEPSTRVQHAFDCYARHFAEIGQRGRQRGHRGPARRGRARRRAPCPNYDLLVGGFPCQDYSVAKLLNQAHGIQGKKGVLWWQIHRLIEMSRPPLVFLENVDRLLKSPAVQRGRDFAIMLASLSDLGYVVEWRVINAADYGFPQRRRRVFIVGAPRRRHPGSPAAPACSTATACLHARSRSCSRSDDGALRLRRESLTSISVATSSRSPERSTSAAAVRRSRTAAS